MKKNNKSRNIYESRNNRNARTSKNRARRNIKHSHSKSSDLNLIKVFSVFILFLIVIFGCIIVFSKKNNEVINISTEHNNYVSNQSENQEVLEKDSTPTKEDVSFTMCAIGDVMCHNTQYWDAYQKETDDYDFSYVYTDIERYTKQPDITIANLETSFAGKERGYSNYPTFNSPDELAYSLKDLGVDVLSTAGNHCLDMGFSGLSRTIDVLDKADISHLGTYKTQEERDKILIKYVKGVKIAFIDYTYGTNGIPLPSDKPYCVNLIDKNLITKDITSAKELNPDIIVACMHWGTEYRTTADNEQKDLADFLFKNGIDIILGNHPHTLEPMEKRQIILDDGTTKEGFVIYALGNFICDQNAENTRNSIILNLSITRHSDGKISINKAEYTPIYMYKNPSLSIRKMKLIDIETAIRNYENGSDTSIGQTLYNTIKQQLVKIKNIVGDEIINV